MPDPRACPDCSASLTGSPTCPSCALPLTGPVAQRLWEVDLALVELTGRHRALADERVSLLQRLRDIPATPAPALATSVLPAPSPRRESSDRSVQNTLLTLGALLLAVAATVFAAVTYDRLGAGGRAMVLLALTAAAGSASPALLRRGLTTSAETLSAVALVLAGLDAFGLRRLGLGDQLSAPAFTASAATVLAVLCLAYGRVVPVRLAPAAALALGHLAALTAYGATDCSLGGFAVVLVALVAADLASWQLVAAMRTVSIGLGLLSLAAALLTASAGVAADDRVAPVALLLLAGISAAASTRDTPVRFVLAAAPAGLVAAACWALVRADLTGPQEPLVLAAVALIATQVALLVPTVLRTGALLGAGVVAGVGVLTQAEAVATALVRPLAWLSDPWSGPAGGAREALSPTDTWTGTVVTPLVVGAAAVVLLVVAACRLLPLPAAAAGALVCVPLVPLGLATSYAVALAVLGTATVVLVVAGLIARRDLPVAAGAVFALLTLAWAMADRTATLALLPAALLLAAVAASRPGRVAGPATGVAGLLAGAAGVAWSVARGVERPALGIVLVVVVALLASVPLDRLRRTAAEAAAASLGLVALGLAAEDAALLTWTLAGLGLVALLSAVLSGQAPRERALLGAGLLAAASWVRLAEAGVTAPEPYVVPIGLVALALGHLRRREHPSTSSTAAYAPGLSTLLVPTLLAALADEHVVRPLLLGAVALGVLLAGARGRLRAPLAFGGTVLGLDALDLLWPYAAALPRWLPLGLAGVLLVAVGTTYEQRRREVARLRERYASLA